MSKLKRLPLVLAAGVLLSPEIGAFTLKDAWEAALNYSADFSAAKNERDADAEKKHQARSQLLPQITANGIYQTQPESLSSNTRSVGWNVQAQQVLFDKSRFSQYKQGKLAEEMADLRLAGNEGKLRMDVAKAYFDVLLNRDKLEAIREEKAAYSQQYRRAQEMFKQRAATILDTKEAEAGFDAALAKEVDTYNQLIIANNTLANLTGLDPARISPIKRNRMPVDLLAGTKEQDWQALAEANNPDWALQRKTLENAAEAVKEAKSGRWPTVTLSGGYQDNHNTYNYGGGMGDMKYRSKGSALTLQLSVPLFTGGHISSRIREAASRELQNRDLLTAAQRNTKLAVKQAYENTQGGRMQTVAQQRLLESNQAKLEATRIGRQVGVRNNLEETQAQQAVAEAAQKLAEARYAYAQAYLQLLQHAGVLDSQERVNHVNSVLF